MELNKLEKAGKILTAIKSLDAEIIEIEKFALLISEGHAKCSFEFICKDVKKQKEKSEKVEFDSDGSLVIGSRPRSFLDGVIINWPTMTPKNEDDKTTSSLKNELTEITSMRILSVLLQEKQYRREKYLNQLRKIGVTI